MMHSDKPYFNKDDRNYTLYSDKLCEKTIDTYDEDFRITINNDSKLYMIDNLEHDDIYNKNSSFQFIIIMMIIL